MKETKPLLHIYTGEGKGKTTAAMGLALRCAGNGGRVVIVQLLKGASSGEITALERFPNVTVLRNSRDYGFLNRMSPADKMQLIEEQNKNWQTALDLVQQTPCDMLILDEMIAAYTYETVDCAAVLAFLQNGHGGVETVLTGRNAPPAFVDLADYVTEMRKIKHPFDRGISARKGVEY